MQLGRAGDNLSLHLGWNWINLQRAEGGQGRGTSIHLYSDLQSGQLSLDGSVSREVLRDLMRRGEERRAVSVSQSSQPLWELVGTIRTVMSNKTNDRLRDPTL